MSRHHLARPLAARVGAILIAALTILALPGSVAAHAELDSITPADKSTVTTSPTEIVGMFTQPMDLQKSSMVLVDAAGTVVAQGSTVDPSNTMTLPVTTTLPNGTYTVRWTTLSQEDNEVARGTTTFTVAAAPSAPPSVAPSSSIGPSAIPSAAPSVASVAPSPSASAAPTTPTTSSSDAVIPIVVALIVLAALALWLLRGRARAGR